MSEDLSIEMTMSHNSRRIPLDKMRAFLNKAADIMKVDQSSVEVVTQTADRPGEITRTTITVSGRLQDKITRSGEQRL